MRALLLLVAALCLAPIGRAQESKNFTRKADVIYGRKYGVALTLDVLTPKQNANGLGLVNVISGGWYSQHPADGGAVRIQSLLNRGYTIFSVVHGSQPKFSTPEIFEDMNRAVRFIRAH